MDTRSWKVQLVLAAAAMLSIAAPPAIAQMPPGNITVTETTTLPNGFVQVEVTVTTPQGQLVSKTETIFNPVTNQIVQQERVTVMNGVTTKVEEKIVNGVVVQREVVTITTQNGQQVKVEQEFRLVNGQLVLVKEEREVERIQAAENEKELKEAENQHENEVGDHNGGGESGHDSGGDNGGGSDGGHD
jgi:uncharacterized membrane protein YgcG